MTFIVVTYLVEHFERSALFPYGRLANPLLEAESVRGSVPGNVPPYYIYDPYLDNRYAMPNIQLRYPDFHTRYYGLNTPEMLQRLYDRIGDPTTGSNNICLVYAGGGFADTTIMPTEANDTRVQLWVDPPSQEPPYWRTGKLAVSAFGLGDGFVPGVSGGALDIWAGNLLARPNGFDLDKELLENLNRRAAHGKLVGYGMTHQHVAECLTGSAPSFLFDETPSGEPIPGASALTAQLATTSNDESANLLEQSLLISARGSIELTLTDAQGRRLGYDSQSAEVWAEIPNASYMIDERLGIKYLLLLLPDTGEHGLTITGTGQGDYTVLGSYYDATGQVNLLYLTGQSALGVAESVTVDVPIQAIDAPSPPDVIAGPDIEVREGEAVTFTGRVIDLNPDDAHTYTWDFGDGSAPGTGTLTPAHVYGDDGGYAVILTVTDSAGFEVNDMLTVNVTNSLPVVDSGSNLLVNPGQALTFNGSVTDPGTLDTHTLVWDFGDGTTASGTLTPTHTYATVGTYAVTLTVQDDDGGISSDVLIVSVQYNFTGFFQPVDNLPTLNTVNAGRAIPVKFSLGGNYGLNIFATGYPASSQATCGTTAEDAIEETVTAGNSGLSYTVSNQQYTYVWKTEASWAGTCRTLVIKLNDGMIHRANFKFR